MIRLVVLVCALSLPCASAAADGKSVIRFDRNRISLGMEGVHSDSVKDSFGKLRLKQPPTKGIVLLDSIPDGPIHKAGLRTFDLITVIDGQKTDTPEQFAAKTSQLTGDEIFISGFTVVRGKSASTWKAGRVKVKPMTLAEIFPAAMTREVDLVSKTTTVRESSAPAASQIVPTVNLTYLITNGKAHSPRLNVQYVGQDFISLRSIVLQCRDESLSLNLPDVHIENSRSQSWEWSSTPVTWGLIQQLEAMWRLRASGTLRHNGRDYKSDRELELDEICRIEHTAYAYELDGGVWPDK